MKKLFLISFLFLSLISLEAQQFEITIPANNGLSYDNDTIQLGGTVNNETLIQVASESFIIVAPDTNGLFIIQDSLNYGVWLGNPSLMQGINVYNSLMNIASMQEMNVFSDNIVFRNSNFQRYFSFENNNANFECNVFLNAPSYASNADAVSAGRPVGSLYYNTHTNSYSRVN